MYGYSRTKSGKKKVKKLENPYDSTNMYMVANHVHESKSAESSVSDVKEEYLIEMNSDLSENVAINYLTCDESDIICPKIDSEEFNKLVTEFQDQRAKASQTVYKIIKQSTKFSEHIARRMGLDSKLANEPELFIGGKLQPYQKEGLKWLQTLYENGLNGILADEMGLGKTVQSIALIAYLLEQGVRGPFLVCGPLSVLTNWHSEFQKFAPDIPIVLYHGVKEYRKSLYSSLKMNMNSNKSNMLPVFITSYALMLNDHSLLSDIRWKYLIIDEGHRVKNHKCKLFRLLKCYNFDNMLFLTGTPLQNSLSELWSLLNIALPSIFNDMDGFNSIIDVAAISSEVADRLLASEEQKDHLITDLHQILTPFMLRRTKKEVGLKIPPKKELIVYAPMMPLQLQYYDAVLKGEIERLLKPKPSELPIGQKRKRKQCNYFIDDDDRSDYSDDNDYADEQESIEVNVSKERSSPIEKENRVHVTSNEQMMLRQVCMHPYLLCCPTLNNRSEMQVNNHLVDCCGKMKILDVMLPELKKRGHKVLIFTQMVRMLDILMEYCLYRKFPHQVIIGSMKLEERSAEINEFNSNPESFIFLISTKAGGLGLNLTAADTVIIYDSDWNPQNDLQAQDRCHRIGQVKEVVVYRLVTIHSVEEMIINRATNKRKLEKLVIKDGRFSTMDTLSKRQQLLPENEILQLFHSCNNQTFVEGKDVISKINLNLLLDRSDLTYQRNVSGVFRTLD